MFSQRKVFQSSHQFLFFSFWDTHLGHGAFLSFLYSLLSQHLSFFPSSSSSSLLFLCLQVVQSKKMFFLYFCSLSTWHCWNQASKRNCCFVVQAEKQDDCQLIFCEEMSTKLKLNVFRKSCFFSQKFSHDDLFGRKEFKNQ